MYNINDVHTQY